MVRDATLRKHETAFWLAAHVRPYTAQTLVTLSLATLGGVISTVDPLLMRYLIDKSLPSHHILNAAVCVGLIALCFVSRPLLSGWSGLLGFRVTQRIGIDLKQELLDHMTLLSADWHERTPLGEKLSRLDTDVDQIAQFGADAVNSTIRVAILFTINLAIMLRLNVSMTLTILPLFVAFYFVRRQFKSLIQVRAKVAQDSMGRSLGRIAEHLDAVPQIHLLGAETRRRAASMDAWSDVLAAQWRQRKTEIAFSVSITLVLGLATLFVLGVGSFEFIQGTVTLGTIVAFYAYISRIFEPLSSAMELYSRSQRMFASARRVLEVLETEPSVRDTGDVTLSGQPIKHDVRVESVSFKYSQDEWTLRDVSLRFRPCESIAIVGPSGSGKSTLARLLVRMADPTRGSVLLDERKTTSYSLHSLREIISYVPQRPILFRGTLRENLLFANPTADDGALDEVVEAAQLRRLLHRLPNGLDYMLETGAAGLSGGEQQRLAIARALLRYSPILILDEATSALDVPTEMKLLRAIRGYRPETTLIAISHRLKSLTWMDRFIVLDRGAVVGQGDHSTLQRENELYRKLLDADIELSKNEAEDGLFAVVDRVLDRSQLRTTFPNGNRL